MTTTILIVLLFASLVGNVAMGFALYGSRERLKDYQTMYFQTRDWYRSQIKGLREALEK